MLKFIGDKFHKATIETFCKNNVLFVHAADNIRFFFFFFLAFISSKFLDENIYLWSLRYESKGPIFELWLETMLHIKPEIVDKLESVPAFLNFFWVMKVFI